MKHVLRTIVALALISTAVAPGGRAHAAGEIPCTAEYDVALTPGPSLKPSSGTFTTSGETGKLMCTGSIGDKVVSGEGTWGEDGRYGIAAPYACTDEEGDFDQQSAATVPTSAGPVHLKLPLSGKFGPLKGGGAVGGTFTGPRIHGSFTILPLVGDCVSAPITRLHVQVHALMAGD